MAAQENHVDVVRYLLTNSANQTLTTEVQHDVQSVYGNVFYGVITYNVLLAYLQNGKMTIKFSFDCDKNGQLTKKKTPYRRVNSVNCKLNY